MKNSVKKTKTKEKEKDDVKVKDEVKVKAKTNVKAKEVLKEKKVLKEKENAKEEDFTVGVERALRRAGRVARKIARFHGTPIYIWKNGKVVAVKP